MSRFASWCVEFAKHLKPGQQLVATYKPRCVYHTEVEVRFSDKSHIYEYRNKRYNQADDLFSPIKQSVTANMNHQAMVSFQYPAGSVQFAQPLSMNINYHDVVSICSQLDLKDHDMRRWLATYDRQLPATVQAALEAHVARELIQFVLSFLPKLS
jgi:hypothetical protein